MTSTRPLEPIASIEEYAGVAARLADPFARRDDVLREAGIGELTMEAATKQWRLRLAAEPAAAALFARAFQAERDKLRGASPALTQGTAVAVSAPLAPDQGTAREAPPVAPPDPETTMVPMLQLSAAVLPFQPGRFEPPPSLPVAPVVRVQGDPDATGEHPRRSDVTLPFLRMLPSDVLKPRKR